MTIATTSSTVTAAGNNSTTSFSFPFVYGTASNIVVTFVDTSGNETILLQGSQYTLTLNAPGAGQIWGVGGTVTYPLTGSPIATGTYLVISRVVPLTQLISIANQGAFYPQVVEKAIDILEMQIQEVAAVADRAIVVNPADPNPSTPLPPASQRAGQYAVFDSQGNMTAGLPVSGSAIISAAMQPVVAASTTRAAAALVGAITVVANIASLRANAVEAAGVVFVEGYYTATDGGEGFFWLNAADSTSSDNGGTIIVDADGGRWYREYPGGITPVQYFGAKGDGSTDDYAAIQAALNAAQTRRDTVWTPATGHLYILSHGLSVPNGVTLKGPATRSFDGMNATPAQWAQFGGAWFQSNDTTNATITIAGHGITVGGINFVRTQPVPTGSSFTPTTYPWEIQVASSGAGDMCNLEDIMMVGVSHGIDWEYPSANGGGTGVNWRNLLIGALIRGFRTDNVNDVICMDNVHIRNLYYASDSRVVTWLEANLVGWDCHYCDNPMVKGLEFFDCNTAILLSNGTCLGNTHSLFNAILTDVQHFGGYFVQVGTTTVVSSAHFTNLLLQTDTTNTAITDVMLELVSDGIDWVIDNCNAVCGSSFAAIGNGAGGRLALDNIRVQWGATASGQTGIIVETGAALQLGSRQMTKLNGGTYISGGGAGDINSPYNIVWQPWSVAAQSDVTSPSNTGFSTACELNPITQKRIQGRIAGVVNIFTGAAGTGSIKLSNFAEITASFATGSTGNVTFDSGWIDLTSGTNILGTVLVTAPTGARVQSGSLSVMLR